MLVTDLHLGHINALGAAQDVVQRINAQKPDLVLIGGDIVDENSAMCWITARWKH